MKFKKYGKNESPRTKHRDSMLKDKKLKRGSLEYTNAQILRVCERRPREDNFSTDSRGEHSARTSLAHLQAVKTYYESNMIPVPKSLIDEIREMEVATQIANEAYKEKYGGLFGECSDSGCFIQMILVGLGGLVLLGAGLLFGAMFH